MYPRPQEWHPTTHRRPSRRRRHRHLNHRRHRRRRRLGLRSTTNVIRVPR